MVAQRIALNIMDVCERIIYRNYHLYQWVLTHLPANIQQLSVHKARYVFEQARQEVPAYRQFLARQGFIAEQQRATSAQFAAIPESDKNTYVRAFSTAERCVGGHIPALNVTVDESSGSTGVPYNWVRSQAEVEHVRRACSYFHRYYFGDEPLFVINAFSMGAWATGVTLGAALGPNGIVKSTGPDVEKILHTLRFFGPNYRYLITGYPPFLKHLLDTADAQGFDWTGYRLVATVGGEGMSENLRHYLERHFEKIFSGYGASDLEIGVAGETDLSVAIRQLLVRRADVRRALLGDEEHRIPMLFQYNPLDYYIESNSNAELLVTINRRILSPRIRYNIKDEGGAMPFNEMCQRLRMLGIDPTGLVSQGSRIVQLPFVYVFGRRDSTISYMGANIYPEDVEAGLLANHDYAGKLGAFCMELLEDSQTGEVRPCIHVEVNDGQLSTELASRLQQAIRHKLYELNADFRQAVREDPSAAEFKVELHCTGEGPFAPMRQRLKNRYIIEPSGQQHVLLSKA